MFVYVFLILSIVFFFVFGKHNKKIKIADTQVDVFYVASFFIVFFISALRYYVGDDYVRYYRAVENLQLEYLFNRKGIEGAEFINSILLFTANYIEFPELYFIINAFITQLLIFLTLEKYSVNKFASLLFYISFVGFYFNSFSIVRFFSALSILFYAVRYLENRKSLQYFICVFLAIGFHMSAVFGVVFYCLKNIKLGRKSYIFLLFLSPILGRAFFYFLGYIVPEAYLGYLGLQGLTSGRYAIVPFLLLSGLLISLYPYIANHVAAIVLQCFYIGMIVYSMFYTYQTIGNRLSLYGTIFSTIICANVIYSFRQKNLAKFIYVVLCVLLYFLSLYTWGDDIMPYKTFLFQ